MKRMLLWVVACSLALLLIDVGANIMPYDGVLCNGLWCVSAILAYHFGLYFLFGSFVALACLYVDLKQKRRKNG